MILADSCRLERLLRALDLSTCFSFIHPTRRIWSSTVPRRRCDGATRPLRWPHRTVPVDLIASNAALHSLEPRSGASLWRRSLEAARQAELQDCRTWMLGEFRGERVGDGLQKACERKVCGKELEILEDLKPQSVWVRQKGTGYKYQDRHAARGRPSSQSLTCYISSHSPGAERPKLQAPRMLDRTRPNATTILVLCQELTDEISSNCCLGKKLDDRPAVPKGVVHSLGGSSHPHTWGRKRPPPLELSGRNFMLFCLPNQSPDVWGIVAASPWDVGFGVERPEWSVGGQ